MKFCRKFEKFSLNVRKCLLIYISQKIVFSQKGYSERTQGCFQIVDRNFSDEMLKIICQKSRNDKTTLSFFVKKFTTQMSLWNGRVQFRQHCGKLLAKSMKKLCSEFRSERTHSFWSSSTSKCFSSHSEYTIDNPAFESTGKNEKKLFKNRESRKNQFLKENLETFSWRRRMHPRKPYQSLSAKIQERSIECLKKLKQ